jgi:transposase
LRIGATCSRGSIWYSMDTICLYFEGTGGQMLGQYGYSKEHRPDLGQMILSL